MHEVPAPVSRAELRPPRLATLPTDHPTASELFGFMAEAELRFQRLRMRVVDRRWGAAGEEIETSEIWLRHPGLAKVVTSRGDPRERDFDVWVTDGDTVRTYDARTDVATVRPASRRPVGTDHPDLPSFSRLYDPVTPLPPETLANTFVHPHGYCRNVLASGALRLLGTAVLAAGREAILLRCDHPRTNHVLTDRPDHWMEIGVDRQTGLILLLAEHVGPRLSRHAEAVHVGLDDAVGDDVFRIHVSAGTRTIY